MGTALLLVAVGVLGLRVLAQSNDRIGTLGALQEQTFAYGKLQSDTTNVRLLLAENVDRAFFKLWPERRRGTTATDDSHALNAVARIGPSTRPDRLGFLPPAADRAVLRRIRDKSRRLLRIVREIVDSQPAADQGLLRNRAERLAVDLNLLATVLANDTTAKTNNLIARNANAYASSRNLFIGVAAGPSCSRCCWDSSSRGR